MNEKGKHTENLFQYMKVKLVLYNQIEKNNKDKLYYIIYIYFYSIWGTSTCNRKVRKYALCYRTCSTCTN